MAISRNLNDYSFFMFYPNSQDGTPAVFATSRCNSKYVVYDDMPEWITLSRQWIERELNADK